MTADGAGVGERERLLSVLWESAAVNEEWRRWIIADEILAAGFGIVAQAKAEALEHAAATIPERMRMDELGMHQISYTDGLPMLSRVMLNGATRFAERLADLAAEYRTKLTR